MLFSFSTVSIFLSPQMKSRGRDEDEVDEGEHEEGEDDGDSANEDDSWTQHKTHTHTHKCTQDKCVWKFLPSGHVLVSAELTEILSCVVDRDHHRSSCFWIFRFYFKFSKALNVACFCWQWWCFYFVKHRLLQLYKCMYRMYVLYVVPPSSVFITFL